MTYTKTIQGYRDTMFVLEIELESITSPNIEGQKFHRIIGKFRESLIYVDCTTVHLPLAIDNVIYQMHNVIDKYYEEKNAALYATLTDAEIVLLKCGFTLKQIT